MTNDEKARIVCDEFKFRLHVVEKLAVLKKENTALKELLVEKEVLTTAEIEAKKAVAEPIGKTRIES